MLLEQIKENDTITKMEYSIKETNTKRHNVEHLHKIFGWWRWARCALQPASGERATLRTPLECAGTMTAPGPETIPSSTLGLNV